MSWLSERFKALNPEMPDPFFAFTGSANWMRALAILTEDDELSNEVLTSTYSRVQRRKPQPDSDTKALAYLLMAAHNLSALQEFNLQRGQSRYNTIRAAIVAWYYTIYQCSSAMVLAASGDEAEEHKRTARLWQAQVVSRGLAAGPFGPSLASLVPGEVKQNIEALRNGNQHDASTRPETKTEAWGVLYSYLKGTAAYEREREEKKIRSSAPFKALDVTNFRTKAARQIRDAALSGKPVNFLIQAFRYRGKANYRDSFYLSYGADWTGEISQLSEDLETVASGFFRMTAAYLPRRIQRGVWDEFAADLRQEYQPRLPALLRD